MSKVGLQFIQRFTPGSLTRKKAPSSSPSSEKASARPAHPSESLSIGDNNPEKVLVTPTTKPEKSLPNSEEVPKAQEPQTGVFNFSPTSLASGSSSYQALSNTNGTLSILETPRARETDKKFLKKYGPWGVVTGASQGIGAEYARALAEKGMNVVMVARSGDKLTSLAKELSTEHGVNVRVVAADLGSEQGLESVKQGTKDLEVGLLVNNAGSWQTGSFLESDIKRDVSSLALNIEAPLKLTHHFAESMTERGRGGVLNVGSVVGFHGVPGQASYSANKGFMRNFTEALHQELKPTGVDVMLTNPGPVKGETVNSVYDSSKIPLQKLTGRQVALHSLGELGKNKSSSIPGIFNRIAFGAALRLAPRDLLASIAGLIAERAAIEPKVEQKPSGKVAGTSKVDKKQGSFKDKYGPWGVVTGASQGLGAVYAEQLAKKGMNVVVVARSQDKLNALASRIKKDYGVEVKTVSADMSQSSGIEAIKENTKELDVGLLVNNAGAWQMGKFLNNDVKKDADSLGLNLAAPLELCHGFGNRFRERGGGGILNVGSATGLHGVPGQATYSAGKGFLRNLTESLHQELKPYGVDVTQTNPAAILGDASSNIDHSKVPLKSLRPETVVTHSLDNLGKSSNIMPNAYNRIATGLSGALLPRDMQVRIAGIIAENATKK